MKLLQYLPQNNHILGIAERVKEKFPSPKGQCEFMAKELAGALNKAGIRSQHVMGNFHLDKPGSFDYISPDEDSQDDYVINHDWVSVEGKILDISASQFRKYVNTPIEDIVFINYSDPLYNHYEELGYV